MEEVATGTGKGEKVWVRLTFSNGLKGLEINVQAVPELENFVKNLGSGVIIPMGPDRMGTWYNPALEKGWHGPDQKLEFWDSQHTIDNGYYTMHALGERLFQGNQANLSFLRLVGISEVGGITFGELKPYSRSERVRIKGQISAAVKEFALDYLTPNRSVFNLVSDPDRVRGSGDQVIRPAAIPLGGGVVLMRDGAIPELTQRDPRDRDLLEPTRTFTIDGGARATTGRAITGRPIFRNIDDETRPAPERTINWTPLDHPPGEGVGIWDNPPTHQPDGEAFLLVADDLQRLVEDDDTLLDDDDPIDPPEDDLDE